MGFATYDGIDTTGTWYGTHTIWLTQREYDNLFGANHNYSAPAARALEAINKLADLPRKARNAIRLAGLRPQPRAVSELRPPAYVPRTRPVRRELQRVGAVGFARLGGRRPL